MSSGYSFSLVRRRRCDASGKEFMRYFRRDVPDENRLMRCPACGKGVTLRMKESSGEYVVIPRHLEKVVGL